MRVGVSGGATTTLASNQAAPISIAVDATAVYWTNLGLNYNPEYWTPLYSELPGDSAIMKAPRAGGPAKVLGGLDIVPFHNSLVVDPTTAYANLWQVSLSGGQVTSYGGSLLPSSYANGRSGSSVFAVQQASGSGDTTIVKTGADGGAPVTLATWTPTTYQGSSQPDSYGVTSDGTSVYWTTFAGDVKKVSVSGGTVTTLATNQAYAYGIAVDSTSVYFARQDLGGSIVKLTPK
jgi:hypothetical protein